MFNCLALTVRLSIGLGYYAAPLMSDWLLVPFVILLAVCLSVGLGSSAVPIFGD